MSINALSWFVGAVWLMIWLSADLMVSRRVVSKREYYCIKTVCSFIAWIAMVLALIINITQGDSIGTVIDSTLCFIYYKWTKTFYHLWKNHKDDDDDDYKKKRRSWAKNKLPKIHIEPLRAPT